MNRIAASLLALAAFGLVPAAHGAGAMRTAAPAAPQAQVASASGDCRAIGQQIAAQNGGTLADAHVEERNGQRVCVGVVLVPPRGGERGRQIPFSVPM